MGRPPRAPADARTRRPGLRAAARDPRALQYVADRARRVCGGARLAARGRGRGPLGRATVNTPQESSFAGAGGVEIFRRVWLPDGDPTAVVAIAHGAGEH